MSKMSRKGFDVSHSRPFKATPKGAGPGEMRNSTKNRRVGRDFYLVQRAYTRRMARLKDFALAERVLAYVA